MNRTIFKRSLLFLLLIGIGIGIGLISPFSDAQIAFAAAPNHQERLYNTLRKIDHVRSHLNQDQSAISRERKELEQLETHAHNLNSELKSLSEAQQKNRAETDQLLSQYLSKQLELDTHRDLLSRQLVSHYLRGEHDFTRLLLSQNSPATLQRHLTYYRYLNRARARAIELATKDMEALKALEKELEAKSTALNTLQEETLKKQQELAETRLKRIEVIAQISEKIDQQQLELKQLFEDKKQLEKLLDELKNLFADIPEELDKVEPFNTLKGKLSWPIEKFSRPLSHSSGLLLRTREGTKVKAIAKGRIVFSNWFRGLGFLIIIDHGNGYMSLYGQNQTLLAGLGQWVQANETIALSGQSGGAEEPALYFEIRSNGKPQKATQWCRPLR
jgi:septal ring factor EnvC (AmiA/AmiB activator)